ncbi:hypothetical protein [uncultured Psychrobacter sp.]|uniref:hypothetical protein n=1 Tax=uncultured Psychrobacter sp. TaxID=259303 RepID=UPI0030DAC7A7
MSNHTKIVEALKDLSQKEVIYVYNDYCDKNQYDESICVIAAGDFEVKESDMSSMNDTHYYVNGLGKAITFSHTDDVNSPLNYEELATWLENNDLLDKYDIEVD